MSFRAGASGGPVGLRPGHLRSLVANGSAGNIVPSISFNRPGEREVPQFAVPILYVANECAIRKKRWKHIKEIVSKSGLKANRPGSRRRAEAGPVGSLN